MNEPPDRPILTSRQRKRLRELAHGLKPVVLVGQHGLSDAVVREVGAALETHELIKVRLREPKDKRAMAEELAASACAALCGLVGHTVLLYRPHPTAPKIEL